MGFAAGNDPAGALANGVTKKPLVLLGPGEGRDDYDTQVHIERPPGLAP